MGVTLELIREPGLSLEAEVLTPDIMNLPTGAIERLPLYQGKESVPLGEFFRVSKSDAACDELRVTGDLRRVKRIGQGMSSGLLVIDGDAGMHTGEGMSGGEIKLLGSVDAWSFCGMSGGRARIQGDAGPFLAASWPGDSRGMKGGVIIVDGNVGVRAVERMRRGLLVVLGNLGEFAAAEMIAGTVLCCGAMGARAGASMKRGSIVALGGGGELLPGFEHAADYSPVFVAILGRMLESLGLPREVRLSTGERYARWCGDMTSLGKGEILIHEP